MSDDRDKGAKKDNADPQHKPKDLSRDDVAPTGSVARPSAPPGLSLGGASRTIQTGDQSQQASSSQRLDPEPEPHTRPIAIRSGDPEVDRQSEAEGQQVRSMDEIREMAGTKEPEPSGDRPEFSQSDYAKAFRQAHGQTAQMQRSKDQEIG
ncbi:hypothetical protein [Dinoroseobacter sp. S76]|uniref:hypothetical protein n=1 Tax=Dinoroseobacter sp. S76 TaxID=3415124 RepID=UPI003C7CE990